MLLLALGLTTAVAAFWTAAARADGIGGYVQWNYSTGDTEIRETSGRKTVINSTLFNQQYRLNLDKEIFPNLRAAAGGIFQMTDVQAETDGVKSDQEATRTQPFASITLNTPLLTLGAGYTLNVARAKIDGTPSPTLVREQTSAQLAYRPDGFPPLNLQVGRNELYDKGRVLQDIVNDSLNISSNYSPVDRMRLTYSGTFSDGTDRLLDIETKSFANTGSASYSNSYWKNRVTFSGIYNISNLQSETVTGGRGEVTRSLSPFQGLSALTDTPVLGGLQPNAALIDGNTTAGSGIDIGVPPPQTDARPRNVGLDFAVTTESNVLHVWVDKALPPHVSNLFSWDIYTSEDNLNWTLRQTVFPAPFGAFENRFEIRYQNVASRYVKAVVRPLATLPPPTVEFPDPTVFRSIQVTELQAFIAKPAAEASGKFSQTSQSGTLDGRVRILDVPSVYYSVTYFGAKSTLAPYRWTLSNTLSANHRFSPVVSGSASVTRNDSQDAAGHQASYIYGASLTAVPLPTLTHALTYSGRTEKVEEGTRNSNSVYLTNTAQLYQGIDANLSGGLNFSSVSGGTKTEGSTVSAGVNLIPNRKFSVNMSYNYATSKRSGGGQPEVATTTTGGTVSASYTPLRTLYLFADWSFTRQKGQPSFTTSQYGANWSPFPDGTLHFNVSYVEQTQSADEARNRTLSTNVRWNVNPKTSIDAGHTWFRAESLFQEQRTDTFNANLRINF